MIEWPTALVEEVAEKVGMGPFGSSIKVSTFVDVGVPVISGQHLHGFRMSDDNFNFISPEHAERLSNANVFGGDVIFTHAGNIGQVAFIPAESQFERYVISQRQFYMRCDRDRILPEFVTYYFKSPQGQHDLLANTSSSGVPSIAQPVTYLRSLPIPVPPINVQEAIIEVLGALDDKIELNRRMNEALEKIARATFKSWFVDFDPVRAEMEGGQPDGLPAEVASEFEGSLEDSPVRPIPSGWRTGTIGDISAERRIKFDPSNEDPLPYIGLEHMPKQCVALTTWGTSEELASAKWRFKRGQILFGKLRPYFHKVGLAPLDGVCSTDIIVVESPHPSFALLWLSSNSVIAFADSTSTGTRMPRTKWRDLSSYQIPIPPLSVIAAFEEMVAPMFAMVEANIHEERMLAQLRDTLLPRLFSGEIRLGDAEAEAEDVQPDL